MTDPVTETLYLLGRHKESFYEMVDLARKHGHPVPMDTRGWSQILVSVLTGISGVGRKKGQDLADGSDVKAANTWEAIDTPRFNGVLKAGTNSKTDGDIASLDEVPYLFFVLWDAPKERVETHRCRVWSVRTQKDVAFRDMASLWFEKRKAGEIRSNNFQLHPPRGLDSDTFRNTCGNLAYPLLLSAEASAGEHYRLLTYDPKVMESGQCREV